MGKFFFGHQPLDPDPDLGLHLQLEKMLDPDPHKINATT
jgi:hypothetical protein